MPYCIIKEDSWTGKKLYRDVKHGESKSKAYEELRKGLPDGHTLVYSEKGTCEAVKARKKW